MINQAGGVPYSLTSDNGEIMKTFIEDLLGGAILLIFAYALLMIPTNRIDNWLMGEQSDLETAQIYAPKAIIIGE